MSVEPEGWHMDAGPPSWDAKAKTFSFFLRKSGRERMLCILAIDALEQAAQSSDLSGPALTRIFDAHRQMIELRAAQKLNAGLLDSGGFVLVSAEDILILHGSLRYRSVVASGREKGNDGRRASLPSSLHLSRV